MKRDYYDLCGGALLSLVGAAVAWYSAGSYEVGTLHRIGPGFFPVMLGVILAVLGLMICGSALLRAGEMQEVAIKEGVFVLAAVVIFALAIERAGILLTTAVCVLICTIPAPKAGLAWRIPLAAIVAAIAWVIFVLGLGMTLPVLPRGW